MGSEDLGTSFHRNGKDSLKITHGLPMFNTTSLTAHHDSPPLSNHTKMYSVPLGNLPWQSFFLEYNGDIPQGGVRSWMSTEYNVWFRDLLDLVHQVQTLMGRLTMHQCRSIEVLGYIDTKTLCPVTGPGNRL